MSTFVGAGMVFAMHTQTFTSTNKTTSTPKLSPAPNTGRFLTEKQNNTARSF
jgi:hypothetical protein